MLTLNVCVTCDVTTCCGSLIGGGRVPVERSLTSCGRVPVEQSLTRCGRVPVERIRLVLTEIACNLAKGGEWCK